MRRPATLAALFVLATAPASADTPDCTAPGITPPKPANNHAMGESDYPLLSTVLAEQGTVVLDLAIGPDGKVQDARMIQSSGFSRLDDAAMAAAKSHWLYTPPLRGGQPIACRWKAQVVWSLDGMSFNTTLNAYINIIEAGPGDYPASAITARETGVTVVSVAVDGSGAVTLARVLRKSGHDDLDNAALTLVRDKYHPQPGRLDGKLVKTVFYVAVDWNADWKE
jgi:TonB family protein